MDADDSEPEDGVGTSDHTPRYERGCRSVHQSTPAAARNLTLHGIGWSTLADGRFVAEDGLRDATRPIPPTRAQTRKPAGLACHAFPQRTTKWSFV
ncbi:hypothetical protein MTO96_016914 [Rhipicephalus appendiculatus]